MSSGTLLLAAFTISLVVIYGIVKKKNGRIVGKDIFYLGHVFVLSLLIFSAYTAIYLAVTFRDIRCPFDKGVWRNDREQRVCMVDDLMGRKVLNALKEDNVIALLGDPVRKYKDTASVRYAYYLGFRGRALAIDPQFLLLVFKNGQVDNYYLKDGVPY